MKAILDTNLLVAESLSHPGYEVAVSSLSWAELGYGIRKTADPVERARREARIARLRTVLGPGVPFDDSAATAYETVCGLVLAGGREVRGRAIDLMIAATAAAHGAAVITRNTDDFAGLEGFVAVVAA
ncbi:hypothetical protein GCM10009785_14550 [Brooklawnia cerclae]|nr:PIN domain-containing protein [Brooklawnia cerclae]